MYKHSIAALGVAVTMSIATAMAAGATGTARTDSQSGSSATAGAGSAMTAIGKAEAGKLIGQSVETPDGERIGEVEAVNIGADGRVTTVIVGVGGFLGVGERDVALGWKDLQITENGGKVVARVTKSNLEKVAPYKFMDPNHRGTVFEGDR